MLSAIFRRGAKSAVCSSIKSCHLEQRPLSRKLHYPSQIRRGFSNNDGSAGVKESRLARRKKIAELQAAAAAAGSKSSSSSSGNSAAIAAAAVAAAISAAMFAAYDIRRNPDGSLAKMYAGSIVESVVLSIYNNIILPFDNLMQPHEGTTLPVWNDDPYYEQAGIPPGTPAPPLLVIDVEKTLVAFSYDSMHGKRFVKRPGADKFIKSLFWGFGYYEIVLYSENDAAAMMEIFQALDPDGMCFYLGNTASEVRGDKYLKRLDKLNRDQRRILVVDDSSEATQLCDRNTILVPPFDDINQHDTVLEDLIPFLQAICHENVEDLPALLDDLGTREAEEVVTEYRMRLQEKRQRERQKRNRGLGGVIRKRIGAGALGEDEDDGDLLQRKSAILSPTDIVGQRPSGSSVLDSSSATGAALTHDIKINGQVVAGASLGPTKRGPVNRKEGKLAQLLKERMQSKAEEDEIKMKKLQEIQERKMKEKFEREQGMKSG